VSFRAIPLLLISRLGHYYEPQTGLALIRKDENLSRKLEAALSAAKEAGEVLRKGFGWQHSVRYKGEVDLVTEVNEQAEQVIREILLGAFPAYGMLAEEGGALVGEEDAR
jgi:fructose-1,6-bisphosphatase/inositol monophosphatase family enzyme